MALKAKITAAEYNDLAGALQEHYTKSGDDYVLDTDDGSFTSRISEFRNNNIALQKELNNLKSDLEKYKGIDPKKYKETVDKLQQLEDNKLLDEGKVEELLNQRTERMRQDFEGKVSALTKDRDKYKSLSEQRQNLLQGTLVSSAVASAVSEVGVAAKGALPDIQARATSLWQVDEEGNVVAMDGDKVKYGADGKSPLTMKEWAEGLKADAPHLFEGSSGGGSRGSERQSGSGGKGTISRSEIGANLEKVASGEVDVTS